MRSTIVPKAGFDFGVFPVLQQRRGIHRYQS
jgi:hypothetical protein